MSKPNHTPLTEEQKALAASNLGLVGMVMRDMATSLIAHYGGEDDLRAVGYLGLVLAARAWKPERQVKFSTYATRTIYTEMLRQAPFQRGLRHPQHMAKSGFYTPVRGGDALDAQKAERREESRGTRITIRRRCLAGFLCRHRRDQMGKLLRLVLKQTGKPKIAAALGVSQEKVNPLKAKLFAALRRMEAA